MSLLLAGAEEELGGQPSASACAAMASCRCRDGPLAAAPAMSLAARGEPMLRAHFQAYGMRYFEKEASGSLRSFATPQAAHTGRTAWCFLF